MENIRIVLQARSQRVAVFSSSGGSLPHRCTVALAVHDDGCGNKTAPPRLVAGRTKRTEPVKKEAERGGEKKIAGDPARS